MFVFFSFLWLCTHLRCPFSVFSTFSPGLISKIFLLHEGFFLLLYFSFRKKKKLNLQKRWHDRTRSPIQFLLHWTLSIFKCFLKHSKVANILIAHTWCVSLKNMAILLHSWALISQDTNNDEILPAMEFSQQSWVLNLEPYTCLASAVPLSYATSPPTASWEAVHLPRSARNDKRNGKVIGESW